MTTSNSGRRQTRRFASERAWAAATVALTIVAAISLLIQLGVDHADPAFMMVGVIWYGIVIFPLVKAAWLKLRGTAEVPARLFAIGAILTVVSSVGALLTSGAVNWEPKALFAYCDPNSSLCQVPRQPITGMMIAAIIFLISSFVSTCLSVAAAPESVQRRIWSS